MSFNFYETKEYRSLNMTARDVYFQIFNQFKLSKKNNAKTGEWQDEIGIYCYLSQKKIAEKLGKSERTIRSAIKKLKEVNFITVVEQGCQRLAKIYVHHIEDKSIAVKPPVVENEEVKKAFEENFNEKINHKEAKGLNALLKKYDVDSVINAIKKSVNVSFKKARISYITKVIQSSAKMNNKGDFSGKIVRTELIPDWFKSVGEAEKKSSITYELTEERKNLIAKIQDMSLINKDINLYSNEEIEALIKMQEMKKMLLN